MTQNAPSISRSMTLNFVGDWGQANFHRICSWLCQEFCDRAGERSRVAIWSIRGGGIEALWAVQDGEAQLAIATPAMLMPAALKGETIFRGRALPNLLALAVMPQNDRMVFAIDPKFGVNSFAELRSQKPPLRIATSADDGTNFIGYVARRYMEAHGIDEATLNGWGGSYLTGQRPDDSLYLMRDGGADAVLQEAIMTPWWADVIKQRSATVLSAEDNALDYLQRQYGFGRNSLPAGYWTGLDSPVKTLDFSDFVVLVRDDMADDVARVLTWCLVETRENLERQYRHLAPDRSPLSYPLVPSLMAKPPIPLHPGAQQYYAAHGHLPQ